MEKIKENIMQDFNNMIKSSWTYDRMTEQERKNWIEALDSVSTKEAVKGTYEQRWKILHSIYWAFLKGLNYDGCTWREPEREKLPF